MLAFIHRHRDRVAPTQTRPGEPDFKTPAGARTSLEDNVIEEHHRQRYTQSNKTSTQRWLDWWVIDPRMTKWIAYWDVSTVFALLFVALVTPFEVAYLDSPRSLADIGERFESVGWLFCVNRVVDLLFVCDLVLQFRLMYSSTSHIEGTRWVADPWQIVKHYLLGWFVLDFMSIAVCTFDIIPLMLPTASSLRSLRVLRVMRVLRLIKLIRLLRVSRLFQRWESQIAINYSRLNLVRSVFGVCYICHFVACIWGLMVALSETKVQCLSTAHSQHTLQRPSLSL